MLSLVIGSHGSSPYIRMSFSGNKQSQVSISGFYSPCNKIPREVSRLKDDGEQALFRRSLREFLLEKER